MYYHYSRPAELNKKNIHQNIFFNPRSGTKPVEQEKKPDENTEIIKAGVELFNQKPAKVNRIIRKQIVIMKIIIIF